MFISSFADTAIANQMRKMEGTLSVAFSISVEESKNKTNHKVQSIYATTEIKYSVAYLQWTLECRLSWIVQLVGEILSSAHLTGWLLK